MDYKKLKDKYILRLDKGEEVLSSLKEFCQDHSINLGEISGLGSTNDVTIGLFNTKEKKYYSKKFSGDFEIINLTGNISTMDDEIYLHIHTVISDYELNAYGGHLNSAIVSGTAEIIINVIEGNVNRKFDSNIGLNLFEF